MLSPSQRVTLPETRPILDDYLTVLGGSSSSETSSGIWRNGADLGELSFRLHKPRTSETSPGRAYSQTDTQTSLQHTQSEPQPQPRGSRGNGDGSPNPLKEELGRMKVKEDHRRATSEQKSEHRRKRLEDLSTP